MDFTKYILDDFQIKAFDAISNNINVLVSAPTGSGKTLVAEYAIDWAKKNNLNSKIIYTCPIKSLCNEKFRDLNLTWSPLSYSVGLMTGDIIINPDADIIVMTTEVLLNLFLSKKENLNPKVIIFDEVHYINDDSRGHVWEKCIVMSLLYLDSILVLLSATIGNLEEVNHWLNSINQNKKFISIIKTDRPVPLREYLIDNTKIRNFKKTIAEDGSDRIMVLKDPKEEDYDLLDLNEVNYNKVKRYWERLEEYSYSVKFELETLCNQIKNNPNLGIPAIIFVLSKKKCIEYAEMIENSNFIDFQERNEILHFYDKNLKEFSDCSQYIELRKVIQKGIAYHHSGLLPKIREVVEFLIKNKLIKIVFATETFAVGLNFPVKTVVLTGLTKPSSSENGFRDLYVSEYKQMAGRAGRRFIDNFGNVILWLFNDRIKTRETYPSWINIYNITKGPIGSVVSKYVIEPNYILKNIETQLHKDINNKSFGYYRSKRKDRNMVIPEKFKKLLDIELKTIEFAKSGISYVDKNYKKMISKISSQDKNDYANFLKEYKEQNILTELEVLDEEEESLIKFLAYNDYITINDNNYILSEKGNIAINFNEINPIILTNHIEKIFENKDDILPILSMFIDDGDTNKNDKIIKYSNYPQVVEWEEIINKKYSKYIDIYPKWKFIPLNFIIVKDWLENREQTLDMIVETHQIDMGLFVKILVKMYQVTEELVGNLVKINKTDLTDYLTEQKSNLIRYPLKIESLYINN
jgi:superfamily II DNA/RNA helicase